MDPISSVHNPHVRQLAALRDRRERARTGRILIDGAREIRRAIESGAIVEELVVCEELCTGAECAETLAVAMRLGAPRLDVTERIFEKLAYGDRADGLLAVARPPTTGLADLRVPEAPLIVVIEAIEKPGNLGAILRSADGVGADALIVADPRTDLFNPNVIRASLGTLFNVPLAEAGAAEVIAWLANRHVAVVTARVDAPTLYTDVDLGGGIAIVLGSEARGLTDAWDGPDVRPVRLPMLGVADSLNVSVAAAVLLYEARRQRGAPPSRRGAAAKQRPNTRLRGAPRPAIANDAADVAATRPSTRATKG
jgi:TrmH family RNA methyltransferase